MENQEGPDFNAYFDTVITDAKSWAETRIAYTKLIGSEQVGKISGKLVILFGAALLFAGVILMCSVSFALWLGQLIGNNALGFLCSAGCLLVLALIFLFLIGPTLRNNITLNIVNEIYENDDKVQ